MGWNAPHNTYAHLYVNGMYWGLYNPTERPTDGFAASYFGGEKEEYDVYNSGELLDGTSEAWDRLFELISEDLTVDSNYEAVSQILDVDAYIDYMLMNHYGGNQDWDDHNWYSTRRRTDDGKWYFYMWDSEFLFIGENDNTIGVSDGPKYPAALLGRDRGGNLTGLRSNEEFRMRYADRIQQHFYNDGALTPQSAIDRWEARSSQITDAIVAESARWGDYRRDVDQSGVPLVLLERDVQWVAERERLLNDYFPARTGIVVEQYREAGLFPSIDAPVLNQHGGAVSAGFQLTVANPNESGTVYYTLDGSDPRLPGGGVAPGAVVYDGSSIALNEARLIKARILSGTEWSALTQTEFVLTTPDSPFNLRVTEVNFHPHEANLVPGQGEAEVQNSQFEFVELTNISTEPIDVSDVRFSRGIDFTFAAGATLAPGQHVLVVKDRAAFESRYGTGLNVAGEFAGGDLSDSGETLELTDGAGNRIQAFSYGLGAALPSRASGGGATLEVADPQDAVNVRASSRFGGSPGSANVSLVSSIVVSEILSHTASPDTDKIELRNTSNAPVDISHWYVGNADDQFAYAIPAGTTIPARGYHVIDETQLGFGLNSGRGGEISIIAADANGRPQRFADRAPFGPSALGVSLGRWPDQSGEFIPLSTVTMGSTNSGLRFSDVVISEVHYNPVDPDGAGIIRANNLEFVELYNQTDGAIDLSGWQLTGGTEYTFPAGTRIEAGKTVLVVGFDPNRGSEKIVFGFHFGIDPSTPVLGPYSDRLDDDGALVQLQRPDLPPVEEPDFTPYLILDGVQYADVSPWPTSPDQGGASLTRTSGNTLGAFPASWTARAPSPGTVDFVLRLAGDANEDGRFNQADIVAVLQAGKFLTGQPAAWTEGDWTGDGLFNQLDIVAALQTGAYLQGAQAATTVDAALRGGA
jgi:hypothetical protein